MKCRVVNATENCFNFFLDIISGKVEENCYGIHEMQQKSPICVNSA